MKRQMFKSDEIERSEQESPKSKLYDKNKYLR